MIHIDFETRSQVDIWQVGAKNFRMPGGRKLDEKTVLAIRKDFKRGETTLQQIADKYGTGFSNISAIILRKSWKWL